MSAKPNNINLSDINVGISSVNRENGNQEDTLGRNERIELYSKENVYKKEYQHSNPDSREGQYAYTNPVAYEDSVCANETETEQPKSQNGSRIGEHVLKDERTSSNSNSKLYCFKESICYSYMLKVVTDRWKLSIAVLAVICIVLLIIIIILISVLQKSTDKDGEIGLDVKSICEYGVCANNGTCSENETNFKCQCMKGYYGRVCEHMVCSNIICYNGGFCVINGSFGECLCPPGFYGSHCEGTPCSNVTCKNGGICYSVDGKFNCSCPDGTSGKYCEHTPCDRPEVRCLNGGSCLFSSNTSTCACSYRYFGEACEKYCQYGAQYYSCTFEEHEDGCFLQNDLSDNFNWTRNTGTTPSKYTGPSSAFEGTYYLYIEASPPVQEKNIARLISSQSLSTCLRCLKFSYHMYGTAVGSLNIYHGDQKLWTQSGSHGDMWNTLSLEVDGAMDKRVS
ncbi:uncharacterized protein LOC143054280 [Mytilus galloprovincialis]|uniref:uncharacterized protein LOC143054280 n=1 Tax=Mytilus galloprovincialis TaxID=29158 RepID=UPI003F7BE777